MLMILFSTAMPTPIAEMGLQTEKSGSHANEQLIPESDQSFQNTNAQQYHILECSQRRQIQQF